MMSETEDGEFGTTGGMLRSLLQKKKEMVGEDLSVRSGRIASISDCLIC